VMHGSRERGVAVGPESSAQRPFEVRLKRLSMRFGASLVVIHGLTLSKSSGWKQDRDVV
jgi:hypothetical protein